MERRFIEQAASGVTAETRDGDDGPSINGYAAVFYDGTDGTEYKLWDGAVERIMPGAFDNAIVKDDVRGLFNHGPDNLLGRTSSGTMELAADAKGLRYSIDVGSTTIGADVTEHIKRGDLTGSSFAFSVTEERWIKPDDGPERREILGVRLFDTGPVTYPAYEATTTGVRSVDDPGEARASYDAWKAEGDTKKQAMAERDRVASKTLLDNLADHGIV